MSLNYRVGAFGFPQGSEASARGALNLGDKDVLAALQWTQENIGSFGGDKSKVRYTLNPGNLADFAIITL